MFANLQRNSDFLEMALKLKAIARVQSSLGPSFYEAYHEVLPRTPLHEFRQRLWVFACFFFSWRCCV